MVLCRGLWQMQSPCTVDMSGDDNYTPLEYREPHKGELTTYAKSSYLNSRPHRTTECW